MMPDIHTLSGAYALDAVDADERAAFEAHLDACEACREEVASLHRATAELADSLAEQPPAELRARLRALVERTPQAPPLTTRPTAQASSETRAAESNVVPLVPRRRRLVVIMATAAAIIAVFGVTAVVRQQHGPTQQQTISAAEVFGSADARVKDIALPGGQVRVGLSKHLGLLAVDGADMPPLKPNRAYQLWLVTDTGTTSIAVMEDDETSTVTKIPSGGHLAVTTEPYGGSTQPTSPPILTLDPGDI